MAAESEANNQSIQQLQDIKSHLKSHRDSIKPYFGLIFWELHDISRVLAPQDFNAKGLSLTMESPEDEVLATFLAMFMQVWDSSGDFGAAARFVSSTLEMSGDEMIQTREIWNQQVPKPS